MKNDNDFFVNDVMLECRQWKAELAAEYPTVEAYSTHRREYRERLEAEGWKFANPADITVQRQEA